MLIGEDNKINEKLVEELSQVYPIKFKDLKTILEYSEDLYSPRIILVNLMDVGSKEDELIQILKFHYSDKKLIAFHCFESEKMIRKTLEKGYDGYLSLFNISEEFSMILLKQELI